MDSPRAERSVRADGRGPARLTPTWTLGPWSGTLSVVSARWMMAGLALLGACSSAPLDTLVTPRADASVVLDAEAPDLADGGADAGISASIDGGTASDGAPTLTIRTRTREVDLGGARVLPLDSSAWRASVVQAGQIVGEASGSGSGLITGLPAPPGERSVVIVRPGASTVVVVGTSTIIDLTETVARRDTPAAPRDTRIALTLRGLTPWQTTADYLVAFSGASGPPVFGGPSFERCPREGATQIDRCVVEWSPSALLAGRPQDDLLFARLGTEARGDLHITRMVSLGRATRVRLAPGATTAVTATAAALAAEIPLELTFGDAREGALGVLQPSAPAATVSASIDLHIPGGARSRLLLTPAPSLLSLTWAPTRGPRRVRERIPRAPDGGWQVEVRYLWYALLPQGPNQWTLVSAGMAMPLDAAGSQVGIVVSAPRDILVDGAPADAPLGGVSRTPRISWTAPVFGAPDGYRVSIIGEEARTPVVEVADLYTRDTAIDVPAGLLPESLVSFTVSIRALVGTDVTRAPWDRAASEAWGSAATDQISF